MKRNDPNLPILKNFCFKSPDSYDKVQQVTNIEGFCFSLLSYLVCNQIWLNYFMNDRLDFGYITKSLKETLTRPDQQMAITSKAYCSTIAKAIVTWSWLQ